MSNPCETCGETDGHDPHCTAIIGNADQRAENASPSPTAGIAALIESMAREHAADRDRNPPPLPPKVLTSEEWAALPDVDALPETLWEPVMDLLLKVPCPRCGAPAGTRCWQAVAHYVRASRIALLSATVGNNEDVNRLQTASDAVHEQVRRRVYAIYPERRTGAPVFTVEPGPVIAPAKHDHGIDEHCGAGCPARVHKIGPACHCGNQRTWTATYDLLCDGWRPDRSDRWLCPPCVVKEVARLAAKGAPVPGFLLPAPPTVEMHPALKVACPDCGAAAGFECNGVGAPMLSPHPPHPARSREEIASRTPVVEPSAPIAPLGTNADGRHRDSMDDIKADRLALFIEPEINAVAVAEMRKAQRRAELAHHYQTHKCDPLCPLYGRPPAPPVGSVEDVELVRGARAESLVSAIDAIDDGPTETEPSPEPEETAAERQERKRRDVWPRVPPPLDHAAALSWARKVDAEAPQIVQPEQRLWNAARVIIASNSVTGFDRLFTASWDDGSPIDQKSWAEMLERVNRHSNIAGASAPTPALQIEKTDAGCDGEAVAAPSDPEVVNEIDARRFEEDLAEVRTIANYVSDVDVASMGDLASIARVVVAVVDDIKKMLDGMMGVMKGGE